MNIYVYVDETQHWGNARTNDFDDFAIRGLKHGIHLVVMTQRPAKISKTIASQSKTLVCFDISGYERKYFKEYNLPYDEISGKLVKQPPYYFIVYVRKVGVSEPRARFAKATPLVSPTYPIPKTAIFILFIEFSPIRYLLS